MGCQGSEVQILSRRPSFPEIAQSNDWAIFLSAFSIDCHPHFAGTKNIQNHLNLSCELINMRDFPPVARQGGGKSVKGSHTGLRSTKDQAWNRPQRPAPPSRFLPSPKTPPAPLHMKMYRSFNWMWSIWQSRKRSTNPFRGHRHALHDRPLWPFFPRFGSVHTKNDKSLHRQTIAGLSTNMSPPCSPDIFLITWYKPTLLPFTFHQDGNLRHSYPLMVI